MTRLRSSIARIELERAGWWIAGLALLGLLAWQALTSSGGTPEPVADTNLSHGAVILDSGLLVLREGLETVLVLAAITASFRGSNESYRKPVALGGASALLATVATWFIAIAITDAVGQGSLDLQAATGLLAVVVLLVVMNWFFHKVYWTGWISSHNRKRRALMSGAGQAGAWRTGLGLAALGFTSVYREGFEVVLFLQNLRLRYGSTVVLEGVAIGVVLAAVVAYLTFFAQSRLPYKKMLVATGVLLGVVLLVMVGESVQELQLAGWIGTTPIGLKVPGWLGLWFSIFPNVQTIAAQAAAALLVIGSYFMAEEMRVRRPRRRGERVASRPSEAPRRADSSASRSEPTQLKRTQRPPRRRDAPRCARSRSRP
ncbi:MAG: FTR1 family protein [Solirubrobacteraceae bacterium]